MPECVNSFLSHLLQRKSRRKNKNEDGSADQPLRFMLAGFIGFEVIRRVSPLLHTPLMSLTNALDAIAVVGAIRSSRGTEWL